MDLPIFLARGLHTSASQQEVHPGSDYTLPGPLTPQWSPVLTPAPAGERGDLGSWAGEQPRESGGSRKGETDGNAARAAAGAGLCPHLPFLKSNASLTCEVTFPVLGLGRGLREASGRIRTVLRGPAAPW